MLTEATARNLERKSHWADHVQLRDGLPCPSWIELSVSDLCNRSHGHPRACVFCPRIDHKLYPNQPLHMSLALARKIADELHDWAYEGAIILSGYGEPLLHPEIVDLVAQFGRRRLHLELVTNGDRLTVPVIEALSMAGVSYFLVSCYDGPQQIGKFNALFSQAGLTEADYALRDRWHGPEDDYGLKLTNRGGVIDAGHQPAVDATAKCFYPGYSITIDWDGSVPLCLQDWAKRVKFGTVYDQSLWSIWTSKAFHKRRMMLAKGQRKDAPCSGCNANGTLHGAEHVVAWQ